MDVLTAIQTRHSIPASFLNDPPPDDFALAQILDAGARAPDHGRLRPWRFLVIRGEARSALGSVFADARLRREPEAKAEALEEERNRPLRAPLMIAVGVLLQPGHPKIPEIEQILSAGAAVQNMLLAAHALGFGAKWVSGLPAHDPHVVAALGLGPNGRIAGFVYLGTIDGAPPVVPHADAATHRHDWMLRKDADGS